jgi:hypothetical protein
MKDLQQTTPAEQGRKYKEEWNRRNRANEKQKKEVKTYIFTEPSVGTNGDTTTIDHLIDGRSRYEQGEGRRQAMDVTMG